MGADDPAQLKGAADFAAAIWNAVVVTDELGDPGPLAEAEAAFGNDPVSAVMFQSLVARKREFFGQDCRVFRVDSCTLGTGETGLQVSWSLPPGR